MSTSTEQLTLDLGTFGWASMPLSESDEAHGGHFRGFLGGSTSRETSAVYEAADRAWQQAPPTASKRSSITGTSQLNPEDTAVEVRARIGLDPTQPIDNMVDTLYQLGCLIGPMPPGAGDISSFSCWFDDQPLALLRTTAASRRRVRFDAAHELGHLVMHRGQPNSKQIEAEAFAFAGAILLPPAAFLDANLRPFQWEQIHAVADTYNVTLLATLRRARDLNLVSQPVYAAAMADSTRRGWKKRDPYDLQQPETLR